MFRDGAARLLVFRIGRELFGVSLQAVAEVIDAPALERMPDSPPGLLGVMSVRGEAIPVYDLTPALDVGRQRIGAALVFDRGARRVGFAVDDVDDAVAIEERMLREAPGAATDGMLRGLVRRGDDLIAVLDTDTLVSAGGAHGAGEGERR